MAGLYKDKSTEAMKQRGLQRVLLSDMSRLMQQAPISSYDIIQQQFFFLDTIFQIIALREGKTVSDLLKVPYSEQKPTCH